MFALLRFTGGTTSIWDDSFARLRIQTMDVMLATRLEVLLTLLEAGFITKRVALQLLHPLTVSTRTFAYECVQS